MMGLLRFMPPLRQMLPSLAILVAGGIFVAQWHQLNETRDELAASRSAVEERDRALAQAEREAQAAVEKAERILASERAQTKRLADRVDRLASAQHECLDQELPEELLEVPE